MAAPIIDLFSDTATVPTGAMLQAMVRAPLGDEQRGSDPTVNRLQDRVAELLGLPYAIFVPTATLANQIALGLHCSPGQEALCHATAHVLNFEAGGSAATFGIQLQPLAGQLGHFDGAAVQERARPGDLHQPSTAAVVVENTSNGGGGSVWPDAKYFSVVDACQQLGLSLHVDGARLFNASIAAEVEPSHWTSVADSAQICFSKGLGCPMGAVLAIRCEQKALRARRLKQRLGGALRQAGIAAGAMLYALDHHIARLADDHRRATRLADALRTLPRFEVQRPETNLVYFRPGQLPPQQFATQLQQRGVSVSCMPDGRIRACTHLGIGDEDVARAIDLIQGVASAGGTAPAPR